MLRACHWVSPTRTEIPRFTELARAAAFAEIASPTHARIGRAGPHNTDGVAGAWHRKLAPWTECASVACNAVRPVAVFDIILRPWLEEAGNACAIRDLDGVTRAVRMVWARIYQSPAWTPEAWQTFLALPELVVEIALDTLANQCAHVADSVCWARQRVHPARTMMIGRTLRTPFSTFCSAHAAVETWRTSAVALLV